MYKYKCLNKNIYAFDEYRLIPIRKKDLEMIRIWRNSQIKNLRQKKLLSSKDQNLYYTNTIKQQFLKDRPDLLLFSFLLNKKLIGYGGLVHINWIDKNAETSFLIETARSLKRKKYEKDYRIFIEMIKEIAFNQLKLHRLHSETYSFRKGQINLLENNGFIREGKIREGLFYEKHYYDIIIHGLLNK